jgi:hypothetical protein
VRSANFADPTANSHADHLGMMRPTQSLMRVMSSRLHDPVLAVDLEPVGRSDDHLSGMGNSDSAVYAPRRDARHAGACDEPLAGAQAEVAGDRPPEGEEGVAVEAGSRSGVDKNQAQ